VRTRFAVLLVAASWLVGTAGVAYAADWRMDLAGSKLEYTATFQRASASGTFKDFDARVRFDVDRLADSMVDVTVVMASAEMIDSDVSMAIRGQDWFDSVRFPRALFHATDVRRVEGNRYVVRGVLTVKGVPQQIEIPLVWRDDGDTATITGELTIKRTAFHIGLGEWASTDVVGPDVTVKFSMRLRRTA
jgi:polyisoprenoid-binding protein YceI